MNTYFVFITTNTVSYYSHKTGLPSYVCFSHYVKAEDEAEAKRLMIEYYNLPYSFHAIQTASFTKKDEEKEWMKPVNDLIRWYHLHPESIAQWKAKQARK